MDSGSHNRTPSLARLIQDFGSRWEIERAGRSTEWVAVLCVDGRHRFVWASDLDRLRTNLDASERGDFIAGGPG
jgi:hypothetical protein